MTIFTFFKNFYAVHLPVSLHLLWQLIRSVIMTLITDYYELVAFAFPCLQTLSKDHIK